MPVCITGASGFIGAHVTAAFRAAGIDVRAALRSPEKAAFLHDLPGPGRLEIVTADLLDPASWGPALAGCEGLVHSAAHVVLSAKDPEREIVIPAVEGTRAVLGAAAVARTVRRVVLTSSVAAVGETRKAALRPLNEQDWNDEATLDRAPYDYAKTREERLAREISAEVGQWELVAINPAMVLGPVLAAPHLKASPVTIRQILLGKMGWVPDITTGFVDVREVAAAHLQAWLRPEATGRYILSNRSVSLMEICTILAERYPERKIQARHLPALFAVIGGAVTPGISARLMWDIVGKKAQFDGTRASRELGVVYRPIEDTVRDTAASILPHLREPGRKKG